MWNCSRRDIKTARIEANEPHLSDVSAEDLGTDSPGADKDVKSQSAKEASHMRDSLEEQVFSQLKFHFFVYALCIWMSLTSCFGSSRGATFCCGA